MKSIIIKLLYIIILPIIIYDVFLIIQTIQNPSETPSFLGYKTFSIVSGSMQPTINIDDIVIVKKVKKEDIQKNDIITFTTNEGTITHRVVGIQENNNKSIYYTKGDNNQSSDEMIIVYEQIEGKYKWKIPKAGKLLSLIKNRFVFVVILLILAVCYLLDRNKITSNIRREERRRRHDNKKEIDSN